MNLLYSNVISIFPNIKIDGEISYLYGGFSEKDIILALDFICKERKIKCEELHFLLVFSTDYNLVHNSIHFEKNEIDDDSENVTSMPNGETIPEIFYSEKYRQIAEDRFPCVIILNSKRLREQKADPSFVASVIVHEVSHYWDFAKILPKIEDKYAFKILDVYSTNGKKDIIGGLYNSYSEIHAKYHQERFVIQTKYGIEHIVENYKNIIYKNADTRIKMGQCISEISSMEKNELKVDPIKNISDMQSVLYSAQHLVGKVRAWKSYVKKGPEIMKELESAVEKHVDGLKGFEEYVEKMESIFDWDGLIKYCDEIENMPDEVI